MAGAANDGAAARWTVAHIVSRGPQSARSLAAHPRSGRKPAGEPSLGLGWRDKWSR